MPTEKPKFPFTADRVNVEGVPGGYILRGTKEGDGTPRNPWREHTIVTQTWAEVGEVMKEWLGVKTSIL
jgi:hypothetical protein